jgi:leucyl/phenylalanyl-tRNA--protein transferase
VAVYRLTDDLLFPAPQDADPSGLLAIGADLRAERLLLAYSLGIFPWYEQGLPILWHSPDPRMCLVPSELHLSRSLRKTLRRGAFEIRFDSAFDRVIRLCAQIPRSEGDGTWITQEMIDAYERLFALGFAHSAESWADGELVGGLYGVSLGGCFFGESMFALQPSASKAAFATLVARLVDWEFDLIDCQVHTGHLSRFGARQWPRDRFLAALAKSLEKPTRRGTW